MIIILYKSISRLKRNIFNKKKYMLTMHGYIYNNIFDIIRKIE